MKIIILAAAAAGITLTASAASAAPRKQAREASPQVTAHEQASTDQQRGANTDFWGKKATYKPHWRNHYVQ
jgi:hypothetical protein